jgi:hypothetical protein
MSSFYKLFFMQENAPCLLRREITPDDGYRKDHDGQEQEDVDRIANEEFQGSPFARTTLKIKKIKRPM